MWYRGWKQSVSIIHDRSRRSIWNYNRPFVRQPVKLVRSSSQTRVRALYVGGSAICESETKGAERFHRAGQECRHTLFVFNACVEYCGEADTFTIRKRSLSKAASEQFAFCIVISLVAILRNDNLSNSDESTVFIIFGRVSLDTCRLNDRETAAVTCLHSVGMRFSRRRWYITVT